MKHKFKVGDKVYDTWQDEILTVIQKRFENGHRCYRLSDGSIVNETRLRNFLILALFFISGCADVTAIDACATVEPYGFWSGLWHGWIVIISWIGSLFSDDIAVYAVNNNGGWYDFGFILGISGFGFTSGKASK